MKRVKGLFVLAFLLVFLVNATIQASSWDLWQNSGTSFSGGKNSNPWASLWSNLNFNNFNPAPSKPMDPPKQPDPSKPIQPENPTEPEKPQPPINPGTPQQPISPEPNRVPPPNSSLISIEQELINLVNQERLAQGLKPLQVDMTLVKLAKAKSHEMATTGEVSHYARSKFHALLDDAGVTYRQAGENLAKAGSVSRVHNGLMLSSGHRANILYSGYTHIGVGIIRYGTMYYATQIFITK